MLKDHKDTIIRLYHQGWTQTELAARFDCWPSAISWALKKWGVKTRSQSEVIKAAHEAGKLNSTPPHNTGKEHWNWQGGEYSVSRGYVYVKRPQHPAADCRGYVAKHRLVAEQKIGRLLRQEEVVHHIDGNPANNHPQNLQVMSRGDHTRLHMTQDSASEPMLDDVQAAQPAGSGR